MVEYSKVNVKINRYTTEKCFKKMIYFMNCYWLHDKKNLRNTFNNNIWTDIKLSIAHIYKIVKYGGFLGSLLSKLAGPLMKVTFPLAKNILTPLGITAAASTIDAGIQKNTWLRNNNFNNLKQRN